MRLKRDWVCLRKDATSNWTFVRSRTYNQFIEVRPKRRYFIKPLGWAKDVRDSNKGFKF